MSVSKAHAAVLCMAGDFGTSLYSEMSVLENLVIGIDFGSMNVGKWAASIGNDRTNLPTLQLAIAGSRTLAISVDKHQISYLMARPTMGQRIR